MPELLNQDALIPAVKPYKRPDFTKEDLNFAPLQTIDISKFNQPGEKESLAKELEKSIHEVGFWVVVGHGIDEARVLEMLAIVNTFFHMPMDSKKKVLVDLENFKAWGYRPPEKKLGDTGLINRTETYEMHKLIPALDHIDDHPFIKAHYDLVGPFMREVYDKVMAPILVLIAIMLELPEDYLTSKVAYEEESADFLRAMFHPPRDREWHVKAEPYGIGGHTDSSTLTALFQQHVAGLQVMNQKGEWQWVKPVPNGITMNAGQSISILTKSYVKATIHKIAAPPDDQLDLERLGLIYFSTINKTTKAIPAASPKLKRLGMIPEEEVSQDAENAAPFLYEFERARENQRHHHNQFKKRQKGGSTFEFGGIAVPQDIE